MQYLGDYRIDDYISFGAQLHRFSSGAVYAPTGNVAYTFYENNSTSGAPTGGNLAQLNSKTGLYTARVQLTAASGFEAGKEYLIHIEATVDGVAAAELLMFRVIANPQVDVDTIKTQTVTCAAGVTVLASVGTAAASTAQTGDNYARLGAPAGASVSADIAAVNAKTTNLPASPAAAGDAMTLANDAITAAKLAADAIAEIAAAIRTELATELARVDVATSSRLATAGYTAPLDAAGTRSAVGLAAANLDTQLGALPTVSEIASGVRVELTVELTRLDDEISSRLSSADLVGIAREGSDGDTLKSLSDQIDLLRGLSRSTSVSSSGSLHVGDIGTQIDLTVTQGGDPVDLSDNGCEVEFWFQSPGGVVSQVTATPVSDGSDGKFRVTTGDGDGEFSFTVPGTWKLQAFVVTPLGEWHTDVETLGVSRNLS